MSLSESAPNLRNPVKVVLHSQLGRFSEDSAFKSRCPCCERGVLTVRRTGAGGCLSRMDLCAGCGQPFWYADDTVAGVGFEDPPEPVPEWNIP